VFEVNFLPQLLVQISEVVKLFQCQIDVTSKAQPANDSREPSDTQFLYCAL